MTKEYGLSWDYENGNKTFKISVELPINDPDDGMKLKYVKYNYLTTYFGYHLDGAEFIYGELVNNNVLRTKNRIICLMMIQILIYIIKQCI